MSCVGTIIAFACRRCGYSNEYRKPVVSVEIFNEQRDALEGLLRVTESLAAAYRKLVPDDLLGVATAISKARATLP